MSATDELRKLLDERGVEYETRDGDTVKYTYWSCNGLRWGYTEDVDYSGRIDPMLFPMVGGQLTFTPEQAIAATLGAGTCHDKGGTDENGQQVFNCSECGCVLSLYDRDGTNTLCTGFIYDYPRYCPVCGRKVEG